MMSGRTQRHYGQGIEALQNAVITIAGAGGVGSQTAFDQTFIPAKELRIADNGTFDMPDMNRQIGATREYIGRNKAEATAEYLRQRHAYTVIRTYPEGVTEENCEELLRGATVAQDGIEYFTFGKKVLFHRVARRLGVPVISSPILNRGTTAYVFTPQGMTYEEFIGYDEGLPEDELARRLFDAHLPVKPSYHDADLYERVLRREPGNPFPTAIPYARVSGALVVELMTQIITGEAVPTAPDGVYIDLYDIVQGNAGSGIVRGGWRG